METIFIELFNLIKEFIERKDTRDKNNIIFIFNTKINKCNNFIDDIHNDYIISLVNYIEFIKTKTVVNQVVFEELISKIKKDMIISESNRIHISPLIFTELNIKNKENNYTQIFCQEYKSYLKSIHEYLLYKEKNISNINNIYNNCFLKQLHCTNVIRDNLEFELKKEFILSSNPKFPLISVMEIWIGELNKNFKIIQEKFNILENTVNTLIL